MRGICGLWHTDGRPVTPRQLARMARHLPGGDTARLWVDGTVGLAQVGPPEAGGPSVSPATALVTDARLDNRELLRRRLGGGAPGDGREDGPLLLRAWERWQEQAPAHLEGDFAFILWDRCRRRLVAGRDHFGVRPLLWHVDRRRGVVAFASRLRCLEEILAHVRLDPTRLTRHLARDHSDVRSCFVRGVERLPPASVASVAADGRLRESCYWRLAPEVTVHLETEAAYGERFRELFTDAVRARLSGSAPVAGALSGGLDSSSISAVAARLLSDQGRGPLCGLTAVFPSLPAADLRRIDERGYADSVAALGGIRHRQVRGDLMSPLQDAARVVEQAEEPFLAPNLYLHRGLYGAAREAGCTTFLDGIDGDTTVCHGLGLLALLLTRGRWVRLWQESGLLARNVGSRRAVILRRHALGPLVADWRCRLGWDRDDPSGRLLRPEAARDAGLRPSPPPSPSGAVDRARESHWRGLVSPLYPHAFEVADRIAVAQGVDPRYPFFDRRLVEFCLAVPAQYKLRHGWTRALLRQGLRGVLPDGVRRRTSKADLTSNFLRGFVRGDARLVESVVYEVPEPLARFIDVQRLQAAWRRCLAPSAACAQDAMDVFGAVVVGLWLRGRPTGTIDI